MFFLVRKDENKLYFVSNKDGKMKLYERNLKNGSNLEVYNVFKLKYSKKS